jgi:hypothetical protein
MQLIAYSKSWSFQICNHMGAYHNTYHVKMSFKNKNKQNIGSGEVP